MSADQQNLVQAIKALDGFAQGNLTTRIAQLEASVSGCDGSGCTHMLGISQVNSELLSAAYAVKRAVGQINVVIHAVGILLLLPKILEPGETIEYVSLGAGNTGRRFDLETDRRIMEFKFIHWRGGPESIRQNSLFQDFYWLAEERTPKRKELVVLGVALPNKFLNGGRSIRSVLSKNETLRDAFVGQYGDRFAKVRDYYLSRKSEVRLIDAEPLVPELVPVLAAVDSAKPV